LVFDSFEEQSVMEAEGRPSNPNTEPVYRAPSVPMSVRGGNSTLEDADVVFVGTDNHYNPSFQRRIAHTLGVLPQPGDFVLTEGERFGGLNSSWIPEMAQVDTGEVTLMGWENQGLYNRAIGVVNDLYLNIQMLASFGGLGQFAMPLVERLKQKVAIGIKEMDRVVLHERTRAMKRSVMSVLGRSLKEDGTVFVYAGSAHLTGSELGGMNSVKHVVLGV
jgi:hypothetical protein